VSSPDLRVLVEAARCAAATPETARRAIGLIDLTSLKGGEPSVEIEELCRRAVEHGTAAVCVYAEAVSAARPVLAGSAVRLATVANFPYGGDDIAAVAEETAAAVAAGADEVDVVGPISSLLDGDVGLVGELIEACRAAAGPSITLKVILETGTLREPDLITAAARAAVMAGVDFLKTSTGRSEVGATLEAAATLLAVCREADGRVGFKAAGGIRTAAEAAAYLQLADSILGSGWASLRTFRFGASSLLGDLLGRSGDHSGY
jgi:deoxyribose-phosphate aldolase